jgi:hypothetical protein
VNGAWVVSQAYIGDMLLLLIISHILRRSNATKSVSHFSWIGGLFHPTFAFLLHVMSLLLVQSWSMLNVIFSTILARWLMIELALDKESV